MPPTGQIVLTPDEFIAIMQALKGPEKGAKKQPGADGVAPQPGAAPQQSSTDQKLDQVIQLLSGAMSGGQPMQ